ncbi:MAG: NUDIX domain-containing protein [Planctomycetaceae bacterium]
MPELVSCGFLVLKPGLSQSHSPTEFLLMEHHDRWDLPKGHVDTGETELECALRELREETGILDSEIEIDPEFRYTQEYIVCNNRTNGVPQKKRLVIFLAWLKGDAEIHPTEHLGYRWWSWSPPHAIQSQTIDPLLLAVEESLSLK